MKTINKHFALIVSLLLATTAFSQIRLPKLVSNGMVLQRDANVKIWGWAAPDENIEIDFLSVKNTVKANATGNWELQLSNLPAGGPHIMTLTASNTITINDILIGDVWLCSGQSNMAMTMNNVASTFPTDVRNSTNDKIRNFNVPREYEFNTPRTDLSGGEWIKANPTDVLKFSATAYFFALETFNRNPNVPIGLLHASQGGTPIPIWMSEKSMKAFPETIAEIQLLKNPAYVNNIIQNEIKLENDWNDRLKTNDLGLINNWHLNTTDISSWSDINVPFTKKNIGSVWYKKEITVSSATAANSSILRLNNLVETDETYVNGIFVGKSTGEWVGRSYNVPANTLVAGKNTITVRIVNNRLANGGFNNGNGYQLIGSNETIDLKGIWKTRVGFAMADLPWPVNFLSKPTALYNGMIEPLKNYALKGTIWYQGEGIVTPSLHSMFLKSMIEDWRSLFNNPTMPFVYVQLPNFGAARANPGESARALFRESHLKTLAVPFTGMATTIDVGDPNDIHPLNKKPVGTRLALAAQRVAYGDNKIVSSGPIYESMKIVGNTIELTFNTLGSSLMRFRSVGTAIGTHFNFAIAGSNKVFSWAQVKIVGNKVIVWNDAVPNPVAVRYAWSDNPAGPLLFNIEGLPASPFRTDSWTTGKQFFLINYN